jgi:hypothetical protein
MRRKHQTSEAQLRTIVRCGSCQWAALASGQARAAVLLADSDNQIVGPFASGVEYDVRLDAIPHCFNVLGPVGDPWGFSWSSSKWYFNRRRRGQPVLMAAWSNIFSFELKASLWAGREPHQLHLAKTTGFAKGSSRLSR